MVNGLQLGSALKSMCSNTLKFITIGNAFTRQLVIKHLSRLKLKWSLSKVSVFSGEDHLALRSLKPILLRPRGVLNEAMVFIKTAL